jgi:hypothetical protein
MIANSLERGFEDFGAVLQTGLLFVSSIESVEA